MTTDGELREAYGRAIDARAAAGRAGCVAPDALLALVRREGREADRLATLDHTMACAACRDEFELLRSIERAGGEDIRQAVDGIRWKRHLSMAIAASAILAIGIGTTRRSGGDGPDVMRGGDDGVTLVTPAAGAATTASAGRLTFTWRPVPGAERYVVEVATTEGVTALSGQTTDTTFHAPADRGLAAGDYRWWVRAQAGDGTERRSAARRLTLRAP